MRFTVIAAITLATVASAAGGAPTPDWANAQTVIVQLSNFKFTPSAITLQHGTPYRLHLVNAASGAHDFSAKQFFAASEIASEDSAKVSNGSVDLDGGEAVDIRLVPMQPGSYRLHCSHFMHTTFGMKGTITVN